MSRKDKETAEATPVNEELEVRGKFTRNIPWIILGVMV